MPVEDPLGRIEDILDAITKIERYTRGLTFASFEADERTTDAVEWNLIAIGQAARYTSPEIIGRFPGIPWTRMRETGDIALHEYERIDNRTTWDMATTHLPPLVPLLRQILGKEL